MLGVSAMPVDLQRGDPVGSGGRQAAREVDEAGLLGQLREHVACVEAEQRREPARRPRAVF